MCMCFLTVELQTLIMILYTILYTYNAKQNIHSVRDVWLFTDITTALFFIISIKTFELEVLLYENIVIKVGKKSRYCGLKKEKWPLGGREN